MEHHESSLQKATLILSFVDPAVWDRRLGPGAARCPSLHGERAGNSLGPAILSSLNYRLRSDGRSQGGRASEGRPQGHALPGSLHPALTNEAWLVRRSISLARRQQQKPPTVITRPLSVSPLQHTLPICSARLLLHAVAATAAAAGTVVLLVRRAAANAGRRQNQFYPLVRQLIIRSRRSPTDWVYDVLCSPANQRQSAV